MPKLIHERLLPSAYPCTPTNVNFQQCLLCFPKFRLFNWWRYENHEFSGQKSTHPTDQFLQHIKFPTCWIRPTKQHPRCRRGLYVKKRNGVGRRPNGIRNATPRAGWIDRTEWNVLFCGTIRRYTFSVLAHLSDECKMAIFLHIKTVGSLPATVHTSRFRSRLCSMDVLPAPRKPLISVMGTRVSWNSSPLAACSSVDPTICMHALGFGVDAFHSPRRHN